ncbi:hypothetical protein NECAME_13790 [Necator americanus]|uniref:Uncharacterized protein n=1 Tax=Necator americanus TaxID=51031 RepID=W2ST06_NECAM|nr:hypothetical protein NECAME_13790 [Necator americanus]ETN72653.1 hypothetical protein NECAME_13790 [Necator americanus]
MKVLRKCCNLNFSSFYFFQPITIGSRRGYYCREHHPRPFNAEVPHPFHAAIDDVGGDEQRTERNCGRSGINLAVRPSGPIPAPVPPCAFAVYRSKINGPNRTVHCTDEGRNIRANELCLSDHAIPDRRSVAELRRQITSRLEMKTPDSCSQTSKGPEG